MIRHCAVISARGVRCSNPVVPGTAYCHLPKHRAKFGFDETWKIVRELYRHYIDFKDYCTAYGKDFISYGPVTLNVVDLQRGVSELPLRQREAFFYNVILDMKQKHVEDIMGITTVSVGQYVQSACEALAHSYFDEDELLKIQQYINEGKEWKDWDEDGTE